jgi:hypothetical protein
MSLDTKKIIIWVLYLAYLIYLYVLFSNWKLVSAGNIFMGVAQGIIPLSAVIFINLVLKEKIKTLIKV